jgi:hypothetical protein
MKNKLVSELRNYFEAEAQWSGYNDVTLQDIARRVIASIICDRMSYYTTPVWDLEEFWKRALEVEQAYLNNKLNKQADEKVYSAPRAPPCFVKADRKEDITAVTQGKPQRKGPLSQEECTHCQTQGLCYICRKKGHLVINCPDRKGTPKPSFAKTQSIKATIEEGGEEEENPKRIFEKVEGQICQSLDLKTPHSIEL